jgi:glycine/D-amino acid oxidase-like deaminating enzyme
MEAVDGDGAISKAGNVLAATNGYSGKRLPWLQRRLIPFDAWMIAAGELAPDLMEKLLPQHRTYIDNNMNIDFLRRSPDGKRILSGGKTGTRSTLPIMARRLAGELRVLLPDLAGVDIDDVWTGRCATTFDLLPHLGQIDAFIMPWIIALRACPWERISVG